MITPDGFEVGRVKAPPCRCGASTWAQEKDFQQCAQCGTIYLIEQEIERRLTAEGYVRVHHSVLRPLDDPDDRTVIFSINTGKDDQLPDHDPDAGVFRPICVAQHLSADSDTVYTYLHYCGACRHKFGSMGTSLHWAHSPYCGVLLGNYVFDHGLEHWTPSLYESPPDYWPPHGDTRPHES